MNAIPSFRHADEVRLEREEDISGEIWVEQRYLQLTMGGGRKKDRTTSFPILWSMLWSISRLVALSPLHIASVGLWYEAAPNGGLTTALEVG